MQCANHTIGLVFIAFAVWWFKRNAYLIIALCCIYYLYIGQSELTIVPNSSQNIIRIILLTPLFPDNFQILACTYVCIICINVCEYCKLTSFGRMTAHI